MPFDPKAFFDAYREAFANFDSASICRFYHYPNLITSKEITAATQDADAMTRSVAELLAFYQARGAVEPRIKTLIPTEISPWLYQVSVTWTMHDASGKQMVCFHTTYTVRRSEDVWRIVFVAAHDEQQAFDNAEKDRLSVFLPGLSQLS